MQEEKASSSISLFPSASRGVLFALLIAFSLLALYLQSPRDDFLNLGSNLIVFFLVNLNVVLLCVLVFLVGRNVVKLIFERRRNKLGSKLQVKLVLTLVGLTLIPTVLLFILASGLLNIAMEGWFSSEAERTRTAAMDVARSHYISLEKTIKKQSRGVVYDLKRHPELFNDKRSLRKYLAEYRRIGALWQVELFESKNLNQPWFSLPKRPEKFLPDKRVAQDVLRGTERIISEYFDEVRLLRSYRTVKIEGRGTFVVILSARLSSRLAKAFQVMNMSYREYQELRLFKHPLKSGYLLTLAMITGMILFAALWMAFYIAKQIVGPIQHLAIGTERIARGDYDVVVEARGADEVSFLVSSFNNMAKDLKAATTEAAQRRLIMEVVLDNLAVGVIRINRERQVVSVNGAAAALFYIDPESRDVALSQILEKELLISVNELLDEIDKEGKVSEGQLRVMSHGREREVICTVGKVLSEGGDWLGTVLLFDDITELSKAQQMAAWREVARRIAHEIKNPLTPIQLSAQRLLRWFTERPGHESLEESAQTIVEHVDSIKRLANEFSHFARMPTAQFQLSDLSGTLSDVVASFADRYPDITFQFITENRLPDIMLDPEQIRRIIINLLDNAVSALYGDVQDGTGWPGEDSPRITVKSSYDRRQKMASFEIADNGPGILQADKARIFDPYFTRKEKGTGLGLAIVTSVLSDHHGQIRVYDNKPRGAKFIVDIPANQKTSATQRRFATV
jgi:two-component system, NtrC family, nitrogen regulation sensor histidine kinase NtrY